MRADLDNEQVLTGKDIYPKTLVDAYTMAINYKVVKPLSESKIGVVPAAILSAAAFSTKVEKDKKAKKSKPKKRESEDGDHAKSTERNSEKSTLVCWACDQVGHKISECPEIVAKRTEYKATKKVGSHLTISAQLSPTVSYSEVVTCLKTAVSDPLPVLNAWEVGIDTMASDHVIVNEELVTSKWESPYNIEISGVGGSVTTQLEGYGVFRNCQLVQRRRSSKLAVVRETQ